MITTQYPDLALEPLEAARPAPGPHSQRRSAGFEALLGELCSPAALFGEPAALVLRRLLTFAGRLPLVHGLDALTDVERQLFHLLAGQDDLRLQENAPEVPGPGCLQVYLSSLGRLHPFGYGVFASVRRNPLSHSNLWAITRERPHCA